MLIPSKYENIGSNLIIIASYIINHLKTKNYTVEELFVKLNANHAINLDQYFNAITFLWLSEIINVDIFQLSLVKNDSEKALYVT